LFVWDKGYHIPNPLCQGVGLLPIQITVRIIRFEATIRGFRTAGSAADYLADPKKKKKKKEKKKQLESLPNNSLYCMCYAGL